MANTKLFKDPGALGVYLEGRTVMWAFCVGQDLIIKFTDNAQLILTIKQHHDFLAGCEVVLNTEGVMYK